ncbi:hypothetical protein FHW36_108221 [Chitinophaga polysaccharea]|uniref:Uncharacterized protein n=1 Tax=Chitinophaga polysaccharea TaxID=1293035 RepID=A0A561PCM5_9BACT|nr:hypothetical protein [Chitinophaga polysaccharea]TWF35865.1 hypothetical protein FHW36_108221 [Chitinophaga polysaccharea]
MEIKPIFIPITHGNSDGLYSMHYLNSSCSEYNCTMNFWRNRYSLSAFFEHNIADLESGFWGNISIKDAVDTTIDEADVFETTLVRYCNDRTRNLEYIFQPLFNSEYRLISLQKSKAKLRRSWLRLYALRLDRNCFIITGGSIKLTHNMDASHLQKELVKLETTKTFLQSKNILFPEDLNPMS